MKVINGAMSVNLASSTPILFTFAKIVRPDGARSYYTDYERDVKIDISDGFGEQTYIANKGFLRFAMATDDKLDVSGTDIIWVFEDGSLDERNLRIGNFSDADVFLFVANPEDLTSGFMKMSRGLFGKVHLADISTKINVKDFSARLDSDTARLYSGQCDNELGDLLCTKVILPDLWQSLFSYSVGDIVRSSVHDGRQYTAITSGVSATAEPVFDTSLSVSPDAETSDNDIIWTTQNSFFKDVTVKSIITARKAFVVDGILGPIQSDQLYGLGKATFLTGNNAGVVAKITDFTSLSPDGDGEANLTLFLKVLETVQVGDQIRLEIGCDKLFLTCRDVFDNKQFFGGTPYQPGTDSVVKYILFEMNL